MPQKKYHTNLKSSFSCGMNGDSFPKSINITFLPSPQFFDAFLGIKRNIRYICLEGFKNIYNSYGYGIDYKYILN